MDKTNTSAADMNAKIEHLTAKIQAAHAARSHVHVRVSGCDHIDRCACGATKATTGLKWSKP